MNISDAADITSLPPKTIRYYEEIGLITPNRTANGYRSFTETHIHQLTFLARARALGFSVEDCRSLLALWEDRGRAQCGCAQDCPDPSAIDRRQDCRPVRHARYAASPRQYMCW